MLLYSFSFDVCLREVVRVLFNASSYQTHDVTTACNLSQAMGAICVLAGLLSFVTYKHIVLKQGSTISYLIGFGFLIPLWIVLPFHLIEVLDLRNKVIKFAVAAVVPTLAIFKTTEGETIFSRIKSYTPHAPMS
jgi:hypothetical protein